MRNTVTITAASPPTTGVTPGSIWRDSQGGMYIVSNLIDSKYSAVSLSTGTQWTYPTADIKQAVDGLEKLPSGTELKIVVGKD